MNKDKLDEKELQLKLLQEVYDKVNKQDIPKETNFLDSVALQMDKVIRPIITKIEEKLQPQRHH
ncbi:MAG: hypothetical protein HC831_21080 [Chloroflexia bacterium]|nr:hypothetical protein [Chloroflexia bacterium]